MGRSSRDPRAARRWREQYLALTFSTGRYVPYESLVARAAAIEGLDSTLIQRLTQAYGQLRPWPEAPRVAGHDRRHHADRHGDELFRRARAPGRRSGWRAVRGDGDRAERWSLYKPQPEPYRRALDMLALPAERVLFVVGSPYDIPGAGQIGMDVWWHNRIGMPADPAHRPLAEHRSLDLLPAFVRGAGG